MESTISISLSRDAKSSRQFSLKKLCNLIFFLKTMLVFAVNLQKTDSENNFFIISVIKLVKININIITTEKSYFNKISFPKIVIILSYSILFHNILIITPFI